METSLVYITTGSLEEARDIGQIIVSERLAAGVNIIDNVHSMYWWAGKLQNEREVIVIAKTKDRLVPELTARVKSIHSYECPCIVSLPIKAGNRPFLDWVRNETR
jgi:periplasmic divalent cation tolerance protein